MLSEVLQEDIINYMIIPYLSNIDIIKNLHLFSKKKQNEFHNNSRIIQSFFKRIPPLTKIMDIVVMCTIFDNIDESKSVFVRYSILYMYK